MAEELMGKRLIVRMCGECLGNGYIYRNSKRVKCAQCKGEGVITEELIIDDGTPEEAK